MFPSEASGVHNSKNIAWINSDIVHTTKSTISNGDLYSINNTRISMHYGHTVPGIIQVWVC